ncbi:hypothetical protein DICPUDRAFT_81822 [Dictyostelium purpureum]|uniref:Uncharacterized protein n=1 Tax=Dictyostelium purpureum TaxID=5786 RepID=F0ZUP5_DICPU|nr:uncharacterized protein DICPUDRAFT_81822 [Dictyostelium purpureum]EGC32332.1 hypothetical protein DICPUDRAFT_81822 [Dictyostelium purpureum]|eukprot:XP_003291134.1 hypothetical protein DICPUDRAFT_81822 [Dictyostelium purpureum]
MYKFVFFILVFIYLFSFVLSKQFVVKTYEHLDCTGDVLLVHGILYSSIKKYAIYFPDYLNIDCENFSKDNGCYISNECGEKGIVYPFNKCIGGYKLVYENIDYKENDYCLLTQSDIENEMDLKDILSYKLKAAVAIKKNSDVFGLYYECNKKFLSAYNSTKHKAFEMDSNSVFHSSYCDKKYAFVIEDIDFLIKPIFEIDEIKLKIFSILV